MLLLNTLRYVNDFRAVDGLSLPAASSKTAGVSAKKPSSRASLSRTCRSRGSRASSSIPTRTT